MKMSSSYTKLVAAASASLLTSVAFAAGGVDASANGPQYYDYDLTGKPNVVVISMDDLGYGQLNFDPQASFNKQILAKYSVLDRYKCDVDKAIQAAKDSTKTLRALQEEGVAFKQAFVSHAVSGPSRAAFMTSQFPSKLGVYANEDSEAGVAPEKHFLPILFQQYGYDTAAIGKWHLSTLIKVKNVPKEKMTRDYHDNRTQYATNETQPQVRGFSYFFGFHGSGAAYYNSPALFRNRHSVPATGYTADEFTDEALAQIKKAGDNPFFVYLAYNAPHIPLEKHAPQQYRIFNTGNEEVDKYYEAIYAVDQNVKRLIDELKKEGKYDNTIFVFWADNGSVVDAPLPLNGPFTKGNKGMTFNGGVHIPLFMTWKASNKIKPGSTYDKMVGAIDIMPTLLAAAEIQVPKSWQEQLDGVNLLPYIDGSNTANPHKYLLWVQPRAFHWNIANQEFWVQYDEYVSYKSDSVHGSDNTEVKSALSYSVRDNQYTLHFYAKDGKFELYDSVNDPQEENNLVDKKPEVVKQLKELMANYLEKEAAKPRTELNVEKLYEFKKQLGIPVKPEDMPAPKEEAPKADAPKVEAPKAEEKK